MQIPQVAYWKLTLLLLLNICLLQNDSLAQRARPASNSADFRIVGGRATSISEVPYLVNLRRNRQFVCGGSLVRRNFVITAAHCVDGARPRQLRVVAGATTLTQNGYQSRVQTIFLPGGWSSRTINNDIAVLKLTRNIFGPNVRPIPLCRVGMRTGTRVRISGWGKLRERSRRLAGRVRTVDVPIVSLSRCRRNYRSQVRLTRSMMCAGVPGRDSCQADSGGPLVARGSLCGVVSFGIGCGRPGLPGIYTNINVMRGFINRCLRR